MKEPEILNLPIATADSATAVSDARRAALALVLATLFWGCGFTWAKAAGEAVHHGTGMPPGSLLGPIFILAARFVVASLLLIAVIPETRRPWTAGNALRAVGVGAVLAGGLIFQHVGLDRTSEAITAFLTSLTILFVPLLTTIVFRKPPGRIVWAGVALATLGVWLLMGARADRFGAGEALGLACALTFAVYILAVNAASRTIGPWPLTVGQLIVTAVVCAALCLAVPGGRESLASGRLLATLLHREVWLNVILLAVFSTVGAFGLLTFFQPKMDPTRAALIYLFEPVFATAFAYLTIGRGLSLSAAFGAGLILVANLLVEMIESRRKHAAAASA